MASGCEKQEASLLEPSLGAGWTVCQTGAQVSDLERLLSVQAAFEDSPCSCWSIPEPFASGREQGSRSGTGQEADVTCTGEDETAFSKGTFHKGAGSSEGTSEGCA